MELNKAFYSPADVAGFANVHTSTILNYIRNGKLYAVRLSERTIRIPAKAVQKLLAPDEAKGPKVVERPNADVRSPLASTGERSDELVPA